MLKGQVKNKKNVSHPDFYKKNSMRALFCLYFNQFFYIFQLNAFISR